MMSLPGSAPTVPNWLASWCSTRTAIGSVMSVALRASSSRPQRRSLDDSGTVGLRRPTEQLIERLNCRGHAAGGGASAAADCLSRQRLRRSSRLTSRTWASLSITGHLRCFSDQPVAEIVQCGEPTPKALPIDHFRTRPNRSIELPQPKSLICLGASLSTSYHREETRSGNLPTSGIRSPGVCAEQEPASANPTNRCRSKTLRASESANLD